VTAKIRAVTLDFWGTLLLDLPSSDNRYKRRRLSAFEAILAGAGAPVRMPALDRAYEQSASVLGRLWTENRDVGVEGHVRAILDALDRRLADRLRPETMSELIHAYSEPALLVPPAVDEGAYRALAALAARGYTLAVVSNTMRTPGGTLRKILGHYRLLSCFSVLTFSDECGVRKPAPEIFHLTLRAVAVAPEEAVHVGDDPVLDVTGARGAGMRVVHVTSSPRSGTPEPDAVIPSLVALPEAIARLDGRP
jgi:putative hydrolase of the HAD superfamily